LIVKFDDLDYPCLGLTKKRTIRGTVQLGTVLFWRLKKVAAGRAKIGLFLDKNKIKEKWKKVYR